MKSTSLELELFGSYLFSLRHNYTWTITAVSSLSLSKQPVLILTPLSCSL